jgi:CBS-domain-containing membrane protein
MLARHLMTASVVTIQPDATVGEAAQLMLEHNISCLPVLDEQDHLVGILTHTDFGLHPKYHPLAENVYSLLGTTTTSQHIEEVSRQKSTVEAHQHRGLASFTERLTPWRTGTWP